MRNKQLLGVSDQQVYTALWSMFNLETLEQAKSAKNYQSPLLQKLDIGINKYFANLHQISVTYIIVTN